MGKLTEGLGRTSFADMEPGETRQWVCKREGEPVEFRRTNRELVHDICDANNASMGRSARERNLEWFVTATGEMRIGTPYAVMMANLEADIERRERQRRTQNHLMQIERAKANQTNEGE